LKNSISPKLTIAIDRSKIFNTNKYSVIRSLSSKNLEKTLDKSKDFDKWIKSDKKTDKENNLPSNKSNKADNNYDIFPANNYFTKNKDYKFSLKMNNKI